MYNRYVFDPDGSCRKDRVPDQVQNSKGTQQKPSENRSQPKVCAENCQYRNQNPLEFLKQMLPRGFDTGDLIVVLLLLLMAGDSREDHDNALLTLALYFIL